MKINLKKDNFTKIDDAFSVLKESSSNRAAEEIIEKALKDSFSYEFVVHVIPCRDNTKPLLIMTVYPEMDTVMKIISSVSSNDENKESVIKKLWEQNKKWIIEIDDRILGSALNLSDYEFTNRELTALLLHEVGHIIYSNSLPIRIATVLQFEIASAEMENKMLIRDRFFKKILSLPILNACVVNNTSDSSSINVEIKADKFAKKMGYSKELSSVFTKLLKTNKTGKTSNYNKNMKNDTIFSIDTINQLRTRQNKLMKKNLTFLKENCSSPYMKESIDEFYNLLFENHESSSVTSEKKLTFMEERAQKIIKEGYLTEAFIFKSNKLKRIDPAELDYIDIKTREIKSDSDKMMVISYLHSKLDLVNYYISLLNNPKLSKKYNIPHTIEELESMKRHLLKSREMILNFKIPERTKGLYIAWPENYEG